MPSAAMLTCPWCERAVVIDTFKQAVNATRATRCPYPSCACVVVGWTKWKHETPCRLHEPSQVTRHFRRRLVDAAPLFLFAQAILFAAMGASAWAMDHVLAGPPCHAMAQQMGQVGIVVGSIALGAPALGLAVGLAWLFIKRVRADRLRIERLTSGLPCDDDDVCDFRLVPERLSYRSE